MGSILKAVCSCGFIADDIMQGIGFDYSSGKLQLEPAYCDECGILAAREVNSGAQCEQCNRAMKFYSQPNEEASVGLIISTPPEGLQHCPRCKQNNLQFTSIGLWD